MMICIQYKNGDDHVSICQFEEDLQENETIYLKDIAPSVIAKTGGLFIEALGCDVNLGPDFIEIYPTTINTIDEMKKYWGITSK